MWKTRTNINFSEKKTVGLQVKGLTEPTEDMSGDIGTYGNPILPFGTGSKGLAHDPTPNALT